MRVFQVLLEKILRSLPDVAHVFVLIRKSKAGDARERLTNEAHQPECSMLKRRDPDALRPRLCVTGSLRRSWAAPFSTGCAMSAQGSINGSGQRPVHLRTHLVHMRTSLDILLCAVSFVNNVSHDSNNSFILTQDYAAAWSYLLTDWQYLNTLNTGHKAHPTPHRCLQWRVT